MSGLDLVRLARPILETLAERSREATNLGVRSGDDIVYVDQISGTRSIVTVSWVGKRTPMHCTSNGKVLLAWADEADRDRVLAGPLEVFTPHTVTDPASLRAELTSVRTRGLRASGGGVRGRAQRGRRAGSAGRRTRHRRARRVGAGVPHARGGHPAARVVDGGGGRRGVAPARISRTGGLPDERRCGRHDDRVGRGCAARWTRCWTRSGRTPLVRLHRVAPDIELFAKVEWYGPTGSVKDRIYAHMLAKAEAEGRPASRHDDHRVHHGQRRASRARRSPRSRATPARS